MANIQWDTETRGRRSPSGMSGRYTWCAMGTGNYTWYSTWKTGSGKAAIMSMRRTVSRSTVGGGTVGRGGTVSWCAIRGGSTMSRSAVRTGSSVGSGGTVSTRSRISSRCGTVSTRSGISSRCGTEELLGMASRGTMGTRSGVSVSCWGTWESWYRSTMGDSYTRDSDSMAA